MTDHRTYDTPPHDDVCWEQHHKNDLRLTIMETKVGSIEGVIGTICEKHEITNSTLDRLAGLFSQFLARFESHSASVEARQIIHESKLEKQAAFQLKIEVIWRVVVIGAILSGSILCGFYTVVKDVGGIPEISHNTNTNTEAK